MKKAVFFLMIIGLVGCDFMLKKHEESAPKLTIKIASTNAKDIDKHGCVASAGYYYSKIQKKCIRAFEEGFRLEAIANKAIPNDSLSDNNDTNAYVIFDEENTKAELFIPGTEESVVLSKSTSDNTYENTIWVLENQSQFVLKKDQQVVYQSARPALKKIIGTTDGE